MPRRACCVLSCCVVLCTAVVLLVVLVWSYYSYLQTASATTTSATAVSHGKIVDFSMLGIIFVSKELFGCQSIELNHRIGPV